MPDSQWESVEEEYNHPNVGTLEIWAKSLGVQLHRSFYKDKGLSKRLQSTLMARSGSGVDFLLETYNQLSAEDQAILREMAHELAKRNHPDKNTN